MRQIKFRCWDKEEEYFDSILAGNILSAIHGSGDHLSNEETNRYILQQYTGLKDKNGVEIYEGDIVVYREKNREIRIGQYSNGEDDRIGCFIQDSIKYRNFGSSRISDFAKCEVIGNIFENPELLK